MKSLFTGSNVYAIGIRIFISMWVIFFHSFSANATAAFAEIKSQWQSSEAILLDRNNLPLYQLRIDNKIRRLSWVGLDNISPALQRAVIQSEDRRFFDHSGIDWRSMAAVFWNGITGGTKRGGSTITMQLAAVIDPQLAAKSDRRSLREKIQQMLAAKRIEAAWNKNEILEAYLNLISFRSELQGIDAAAKFLFDKTPAGLNANESLILAALIPAPNAKPASVAQRVCVLSDSTGERCESLKQTVLSVFEHPLAINAKPGKAPHLARYLLTVAGEKVQSTIDFRLQAFAEQALRAQLISLADQNVRDGAVVVLDNASGDVLAYVGNSGSTSSAPYVDGVRAPRQAGSTLKPFLYELAIENRLLTAASILDDSPVNLSTPVGLYVPQNYDHDFKGQVSVRTALASSLNVPAIRVLILTGIDSFYSLLKTAGYEFLVEPAAFYGYSLALGSAEVSLLQQVNAYRMLANRGLWTRPRFRLDAKFEPPQQVMNSAATYIINDILADRAARSVTFGLDNVLATSYWSAVKTGTSKEMRDNWSIGFSAKYTVGVWVGNFSGQPMRSVSGVTGAAPLWREMMDYLHSNEKDLQVAPIKELVNKKVVFAHAIEPPRHEWFLPDTEMTMMTPSDKKTHFPPHIVYPNNGSIIALDPDIPSDKQMVFFEAKPYHRDLQWRLNGQPIAQGSYVKWPPLSGKHQLVLMSSGNQVLDRVEFQVRGSVN